VEDAPSSEIRAFEITSIFVTAKYDELVKSQKMTSPVIPAKAGIQEKQALLDPGFRRGDGFDDFLRSRQI
jgi:hypothetical protein